MKWANHIVKAISAPFIFIGLTLVSGACWFLSIGLDSKTRYDIACALVITIEIWYLIIILR